MTIDQESAGRCLDCSEPAVPNEVGSRRCRTCHEDALASSHAFTAVSDSIRQRLDRPKGEREED